VLGSRRTRPLRQNGFAVGEIVALTPDLRVDGSFGPKLPEARIGVRPLGRRGRTFRVRVTTSGPGLIALRVEDIRGRLLAAGLAPVHTAGRSTVRIAATRRHGTASGFIATFRDLAGGIAGVAAMP
jgi:hypothetical protein